MDGSGFVADKKFGAVDPSRSVPTNAASLETFSVPPFADSYSHTSAFGSLRSCEISSHIPEEMSPPFLDGSINAVIMRFATI